MARSKNWERKQRERGLCLRCRKEALPNYLYCENHLTKFRRKFNKLNEPPPVEDWVDEEIPLEVIRQLKIKGGKNGR